MLAVNKAKRCSLYIDLQPVDCHLIWYRNSCEKRDDIVELLLEFQADHIVTNNNGFNALHNAALRSNMGAIRLILTNFPLSSSIDEPKDDGLM